MAHEPSNTHCRSYRGGRMKVEYKQVACGFDVDGEPEDRLVLVQDEVAALVKAAYCEGFEDGRGNDDPVYGYAHKTAADAWECSDASSALSQGGKLP